MKKSLLFIFLLLGIFSSKNTFSQTIEKADSLGLPGDNLNLYAVLDLFQKSATFEEFEKQLNLEDSKINNLDLNNDDKTDYIKVIDHQTGDAHAVVLQVPVNEKETQDVAVIEIEKDKEGKVLVQIVGNEELYGKDYIVEPTENDPKAKTGQPLKKADTTLSADGKTVIINNTTNNYYNTTNNNTTSGNDGSVTYVTVNHWPIVHYVYAPAYVVYVSPWSWYYYPTWWRPWSPWYWHSYYWHHRNYHYHPYYGYYHRTDYYRAPVANNYYAPRRSVSSTVQANRTSRTYTRTYESKSRAGDGKIKPSANPAYNNNRDKGNNDLPKGNRNNNDSPKNNNPKNNNRADKPRSGGGNSGNSVIKPKNNNPSNSGGRAVPKSRNNNVSPAPKPKGGGVRKGGGRGGR